MDKKRLITGMAVAMLLVIGWSRLVQYLAMSHPEWGWQKTDQPTTQQAVAPATQTVESVGPTTLPPTMAQVPTVTLPTATTQTASAGTQPAGRFAIASSPTTQPVIVNIGSAADSDKQLKMAVELSSRGAGINSVTLNDYKRSVETPDLFVFQEPYRGRDDDETRPLSTRSITIDGTTVDLLNVSWQSVGKTADSATFEVVVSRDGLPAVKIEKTYTLSPRSVDENTPQGSEVTVGYKLTNLTGGPINAKLAFNGPTAPPREIDRGDDRNFISGYNHEGFADLTHSSMGSLTKDKPSVELAKDAEGKPAVWVGMSSSYFNTIIRPDPKGAIQLAAATAIAFNFEVPDAQHALLKLETTAFIIPAGDSTTQTSYVFLGPKRRELLNSAYYSAPLLRYEETLVMSSGPCGWITSTKIINGLYFLLSIFHAVFRDWGLAIICLVFLVRTCLHPITKKSQVNMAKMSKMSPEIERLKKKHGDNKDELNKAMMQFYKTQGATPILGCLPMFLQMPIWIALYSSLQNTFELRQSPFLWGLTWIKDLAHPDRLFYFPTTPFSLFFIHVDAINVLPVILGVVSWIQAKVMRQQQPPASTPEQAQQQKMMQWMTLMLPIILYNGPAGLNLYIMTSTTFGIIESKIIRKHIKEKEAAEKAGVVIVDNPPGDDLPPAGKVRRKEPEPEKPQGGLAGWITKLQQKAEEMQKDQLKKGKKK